MNDAPRKIDHMARLHRDGERIFTTSQDIARRFGKQHKNILRDIDDLECSAEYRRLNFEPTVYERPNPSGGKPIPTRMFEITRDGFVILAMGFTGRRAMEWKERYIAAFNAMEQELRERHDARLVLENTENMRRLIHAQDNFILSLQRENQRLAHKVRSAERDGTRLSWARRPMAQQEYDEVQAYRKTGLTWTEVVKACSHRSPNSLSRQFRRFRAAHGSQDHRVDQPEGRLPREKRVKREGEEDESM
uniref:Phage regulatory protein, rha family n=1 Tax=Candidatus Kentrum sp. LFY TaxID=2126342 RepID=A0A450WGR4_9GAMM|nr:MAG: phage regulatory protein, rha family [Candidatus Kentron sp. LFY]